MEDPKVVLSPSNMELPMNQSGEVDWHTLGNILVAHSLGEVVCASYVDSKFGRKEEGLIPATNWKFAYEEKNVVVLVKEIKDSPIKCFMGRSVIDLPPKVVHECISVNENSLNWDKYAVESRRVKCLRQEEDIEDCISYMRHEARQCLVKSKRDFVFYGRNQHMVQIDKRVISVISVDYPSCPILPGVDRGNLHLGSGWVLEPYNGDTSRTLVSYLVHANLAGLPSLIVNRVLRRQPLNIHYLDRFLQKPMKKLSLFSRMKTASVMSAQGDEAIPDCSVITPEIPTPDIFHDETGYTFSAVTLGSNPLYNWSATSTTTTATTGNGKNLSSYDSEWDEDSVNTCGGNRDDKQKMEESESVLDFRITSIDGTGKRLRPGYLWLPSLRNLKAQQQQQQEEEGVASLEREGEGTEGDGSLPSSDCDANSKRQASHTGTGLAARE